MAGTSVDPGLLEGTHLMMESRQFLHVKSTAAAAIITSCNFKNFVTKDAAVPTVWILGGVLMAVGTLRALKGM
jgi:hypothetical protein